MYNGVDITSLKITIGHPNVTLATISHVGNLKFSKNVILYDVLVVLSYCVSLLSVNKLIRIVKFFPFKMKSKTCDSNDADEASESEHLSFFDNEMSQSPCDDGRTTSFVDGSVPSSSIDTSDTTFTMYQEENIATQIDDESSSQGNISGNNYRPSQTLNVFGQEDVQTPELRRSSRPTKFLAKLNDYVVNASIRYGTEKFVCYSMLSELMI
nr:ribonuclease H-like domain-containing protein [Tanacetum cinerariifolium]